MDKPSTGCFDMNHREIFLGDRVIYHLEGSHTKQEYWNPEYEVIWQPPTFELKRVGGGLDCNSHMFILRYGGVNGKLEVMDTTHPEPIPSVLVNVKRYRIDTNVGQCIQEDPSGQLCFFNDVVSAVKARIQEA